MRENSNREERIVLEPGKEKPILNHHHWIFSRAVRSAPNYQNGDILPVYSYDNRLLGHAYLNKDTVITGRMINFDNSDPIDSLKENIYRAIILRKELFKEDTNCYRLINGEGDNISGLVVDKYANVIVIQIVSTGIDRLRDIIVETLVKGIKEIMKEEIICVYEKSTIHARMKDGLKSVEGIIFGDLPETLIALENGIKFRVDIKTSQKTGLFLDQREMRSLVGEMSKGRRVLNTFSYTGGFSMYAYEGGAKEVTSVDIAGDAVDLSIKNFEINGYDTKPHKFITADAFDFLHEDDLNYDLIILDPPAFAKKKEDLQRAKKGYKDINRTVLRKIPKKSFLLTCSCSYHVPPEIFDEIILEAARDAGRNVRIVQRHRLGMDHPINIYHSEINYLKSLLLYVD